MRMRNVCEKVLTLEELKERFLLVKQSQHTGELAMRDYRNCLAVFLKHSQNSVFYEPLEQDALRYFAAIPDTSPARYNKPFQNVNAFFNWLVSQEYLSNTNIFLKRLIFYRRCCIMNMVMRNEKIHFHA